jgi:hypothetical protein
MFCELNLRRYVPYAVLITLRRAAPTTNHPYNDAMPIPIPQSHRRDTAAGERLVRPLPLPARARSRSIDVGSLPATISGRRREQRGARVTATARHS